MDKWNYRFVGKIDVNGIIEKLNSIDVELWKENTIRQEGDSRHKDTESLMLMWDAENFETLNVNQKTHLYHFFDMDSFLKKIEPIYKECYGDGLFTRAVIVKLFANCDVQGHRDIGIGLTEPHRTHIALITNPDVFFIVDGEEKNMKVGDIWEINNENWHSVENISDEDRIHLIIDYLPLTKLNQNEI